MPDKNIREELAELTEAVRELRDREVATELASLRAEVERLRAQRSAHHCTGCSCMHIHYYPQYVPATTVTYPLATYGTVTSGATGSTTITNSSGTGLLSVSN